MFEIIKNAEIPQNGRGPCGEFIYPFAQMEVGDGFDAPRDMGKTNTGSDRRQNTLASCARGYALKYNPAAKFTVRLLDKSTVRCVRIA